MPHNIGELTLAPLPAVPERIEGPEQFTLVGQYRELARGMVTQVRDFFAPHKKRAHEAHAELCKSEKQKLSEPEALLKKCNELLLDYDERQQAAATQRKMLATVNPSAPANALPTVTQAARVALPEAAPVEIATGTGWELSDHDAFARAIGAPVALRTAAAICRAQATMRRNGTRDALLETADILTRLADEHPAIPTTAVEPHRRTITEHVRRFKNDLNWPGVTVTETRTVRGGVSDVDCGHGAGVADADGAD